ncbi:MAG: sensor histidine kinase [Alphaproteobacteria bacterium]|nr:sensor histidine kinase [Alphaproteobacteria bacterium]
MTDSVASTVSLNPRQRIRHLLAGLAGLLVAAEIIGMSSLREEAIWEAEQKASAATRLLEAHMLRTFQASEYILSQVTDIGRSRPMAELAKDDVAWIRLNEIKQALPEPGTLWITDAAGNVVLGTPYFPWPTSDVVDRYYYFAHLQGRQDLVIGPMVRVKSREVFAFHVSKRIDDRAGSMIGVAAIGFDAPTFTNFHENLELGADSNLTVSGMDGRVILRQPDGGRYVGTQVKDGPVGQAVAAGNTEGVLQVISPLDGIERIRAFKVMPRYGVVVGAGIAIDDALELWWEVLWGSLAGITALMGVLVWAARYVFESLDREEGLIAGLDARLRLRTEEAEARAREAREANESKTRFLAAASHDLRQPLQAAGMFAEALAARLENTPHMGVIDKLRQSLDATQLLLSTLLDVSTLEAGHVDAQPTTFPLAPFISNLADQLEMEAQARKLDFKVVLPDAWIVSDPVLLERVVRNLLVNAMRYTKSGGVLLGCRRRGDHLAICVIDTGPGIPADKIDAIFEDFTRLGDKGRGQDRGLGLGLSVVRRTAQLLGHPIEVKSRVGKGSCFAIVVPLAAG